MPRTLLVTLTAVLALALGLTACAPAATGPRPNATESNATAMADANGILTETRAAYTPNLRPTPAEIGTPPATAGSGEVTSIPFTGASATSSTTIGGAPPYVGQTQPTLANPSTAAPTTAVGGNTNPGLPVTGGNGAATAAPTDANPCNNQALDLNQSGPKVRLVIRNDTRGPISFALGMSSNNSLGQCGYLYWQTIAKDSKVVVDVPQTQQQAGDVCYWAYATVLDSRNPGTVTNDPGGLCLAGGAGWVIDVNYNKLALSSK